MTIDTGVPDGSEVRDAGPVGASRHQRQRHPLPHRRGRDRGRWCCCCTVSASTGGRGGTSCQAWPRPGSGWWRRTCAATATPTRPSAATTRSTWPTTSPGWSAAWANGTRCWSGTGYGGVTAFDTAVMKPAQVRGVVAIAAPHPIRMARVRLPVPDRPLRAAAQLGGHPGLAGTSPGGRQRRAAGADRAVAVRAGVEGVAGLPPRRWSRCAGRSGSPARPAARWSTCAGWPGRPGAPTVTGTATRWPARSTPVLHVVGDADRFTPASSLTDAREHVHRLVHAVDRAGRRALPGRGGARTSSPDLIADLAARADDPRPWWRGSSSRARLKSALASHRSHNRHDHARRRS